MSPLPRRLALPKLRLFQPLTLLLAAVLLFAAGSEAWAAKKKGNHSGTISGATTKRTATPRADDDAVVSKEAPDADGDTGPALTPGMKQVVPEIPPDLTELPLAARGAIVLDGLTGRPLYEKNAELPQYPASTTKIMTALLVIEEGNLDQEIEVTDEDSKVGESSLEIHPGDRFTRRQALYGLMLKSANDVAHALGRDNAGSIEAFAEKMSRRAIELGATATHFANPHGLHSLQHYTSPHDLALIARAAMQQPLFRQIVSTQFANWEGAATGVRELRNHNRLLWMFPGCIGVKTGYTIPAQQVLASAAQWGTREVVAVVMHTHKPGIWDDSKLLLTWGLLHLPEYGSPAAAPTRSVAVPGTNSPLSTAR